MEQLAIVNGHGGNYVLSNVVQEANVEGRRVVLFPQSKEWTEARIAAGVVTSNREDMQRRRSRDIDHACQTSGTRRASFRDADHLADERRHPLTVGIRGYTETGIIGRPSLATAEKGRALLDSFALQFKDHLGILR